MFYDIRRKIAAVFFLLALSLLPASARSLKVDTSSADEWFFYRINAQYRGTIKKGMRDLGCAVAWFKELPAQQIQAIIHVCALHPEKKNERYAFRLNLIFTRKSGEYIIAREVYADFTGIPAERQLQIRQLAGLWIYIRDLARTNEFLPVINAAGAVLALKARDHGVHKEIECSWKEKRNFSGKFFLRKLLSGGLEMEKIRFRSGKLSVSLVTDSQDAVTRDFAGRYPFNEQVFR
jgi:hypothetical protein